MPYDGERFMEYRAPIADVQASSGIGNLEPGRRYTISELADRFGKSPETVRRFLKKHNIKGKFGRTPLPTGADIIRAMESE
jgi:hypothetical protein